jgi:lysophospholipase L1-like esterase
MFEVPSWSMIDNPYAYVHRPSATLLITVGDSWTYGDSLGKTKVRNGVDDIHYRLAHVYGNLMAERLNAGWINLALPGGSNTLMLSWLEQLLAKDLKYKNIICTVTLTESGRHEDLQLIDRGLITQQRVLEKIVTTAYGQIQTLALRYPGVKFVIAHNFTDACGTATVEQSWLEVMLGTTIQNGTHIVISEHIDQMNYDERFPDVLDIMDRAHARLDLLDSCKYCFKEDSRHPNEQGHQLWAEYLLTHL